MMKKIMTRKMTVKLLAVLSIITVFTGTCFAAKFTTPDDLKTVKVGTQRGTIAENLAREMLGDKAKAQLTTYEKATDVIAALKLGKIDGSIMDVAPATQFKKNDPDLLTILPDALTSEEYAIGFKKGNTELVEQVNKALAEIKAEGTLEKIMLKYKEGDGESDPGKIDLNAGAAGGKLVVGTETGFPPYDIKVGDGFAGIDIEMCAAIAKKLDKELVIIAYPFDSLPMAVNGGKVDMICAGITVTEDRKQNMDFSDPYENAQQVAVVMTKDYVSPEEKAALDKVKGAVEEKVKGAVQEKAQGAAMDALKKLGK